MKEKVVSEKKEMPIKKDKKKFMKKPTHMKLFMA